VRGGTAPRSAASRQRTWARRCTARPTVARCRPCAQHQHPPLPCADAAGHAGCGELLALLAAFLRVSPRALADTACNMLAGELVRQEHVLRAVRMAHWSWAAMQHMDGLVQVYAALLTQVGWLAPATRGSRRALLRTPHRGAGCRSRCRQRDTRLLRLLSAAACRRPRWRPGCGC
jgi:hypothetical protein